MKKQLLLTIALTISVVSFSQEIKDTFKPNGKPLFNVFWNYHANFSENATKTSAFELKRAYLGYRYNFSKTIAAKVTFDVGNNNEGSAYTAYLKAAQLDWKVASGVKLSMGLIGMKQFKTQEKFWGYRYIFKSFQDQNGFGSSTDLGVNAEFKLLKNLKTNVTISNGEGYKKVQDVDGYQKMSVGVIYTPIKSLTTQIYVDRQSATGSNAVTNFSLFAGYKMAKWRLGAEYNKLNNATKYSKPAQDHQLNGFSFYSTYNVNKKVAIFGRFDQLNSNTLTGATEAWNIAKNGNQIITGVQIAPVKGLQFSVNYQNFRFDDRSLHNKSLLYLNAQFKL